MLTTFWTFLRLAASRPRPLPPCAALTRAPLSLEDQACRVATIVTDFIDRAAAGRNYHVAAERQIDAASYALASLVDELATVMTLAPRRAADVVPIHRPTGASPLMRRPAIAA